MTKKQGVSDVEKILNAIAGGKQKISASDVMKGLTSDFDIKMISSLGIPENVVRAVMASEVFKKLGYNASSKLVDSVIDTYLRVQASGHKNNRAKSIIEAFASIFRAELEAEKNKKAFLK